MGDLSTGIAYLCGTCCGLRNADITADGSRFSSGPKPDPREREVDEIFMSRNYEKDATGRFIRQPTPTNSMLPRQRSGGSDANNQVSSATYLEPPQINIVNSMSCTTKGDSAPRNNSEPLDSIELGSLPPLG